MMENNKAKPLISVILTVYNGGEYLKKSVESVLKQDMPEFEFLVLDDCSTDDTYKWLQGVKDDRVKLFRNETNKGLFPNLNFLIEQSNSPLIKLWSHDDIMFPFCLSAIVDFHQQHPNIGFSYSAREMIDENGKSKENNVVDNTPEIISTELHARIAYYTGSIAGNIANVCIRKTALDKVGLFKEHMKISADFDMWVRLAAFYETGFIREKLIKLRDHSGQLSRDEKYYLLHVREDLEVYTYLNSYVSDDLKQEGRAIMRDHKLVYYYTLMLKSLMHGNFETTKAFLTELKTVEAFLPLTLSFVKAKIKKPHKPAFLKVFDRGTL